MVAAVAEENRVKTYVEEVTKVFMKVAAELPPKEREKRLNKLSKYITSIAGDFGIKRYKHLINSCCLACGEWLCVMKGTYTGEINCTKCGAVNVFRDSSKPCESKAEGSKA